MSKLHVAYDDIYLDWQLGNGDGSHPTNPVRAKLAVELLQNLDPVMVKPSASESDRDLLNHVHSDEQNIRPMARKVRAEGDYNISV